MGEKIYLVTGERLHVSEGLTRAGEFTSDDVFEVVAEIGTGLSLKGHAQSVIGVVELSRIHLLAAFGPAGKRDREDEEGILEVFQKGEQGLFGYGDAARAEICVGFAHAERAGFLAQQLSNEGTQRYEIADTMPLGNIVKDQSFMRTNLIENQS